MESCINKKLRVLNRTGLCDARAGDPAKKPHASIPSAVSFVEPSRARTYLAQTGIMVA
jgi:hypothetical protein